MGLAITGNMIKGNFTLQPDGDFSIFNDKNIIISNNVFEGDVIINIPDNVGDLKIDSCKVSTQLDSKEHTDQQVGTNFWFMYHNIIVDGKDPYEIGLDFDNGIIQDLRFVTHEDCVPDMFGCIEFMKKWCANVEA